MKISFLISAMVLYIVRESFCYDIQVGTVLFTKTDLVRKCWSENDKALLRARLVMQDVLPDPSCIDFSKPRAVSIILDYIYACFHIINTSTYGKLQNLMYLALADVVGGYLRAYVLPLTKKSYYAGLVTYEDACRVFTFYDQIRDYLKTNGVGWAEPQKTGFKNIKVSPLEISGGNPEACNILYTIEKKGKLHVINAKCCSKTSKIPDLNIKEMAEQRKSDGEFMMFTKNFNYPTASTFPSKTTIGDSPFSTSKVSNVSAGVKNKNHQRKAVTEMEISSDGKNTSSSEKRLDRARDLRLENETMEELAGEASEKRNVRCDCCERKKTGCKVQRPRRIIIPLPILDDECEPHTIAVPFRKRPLRNLWKKTSAFILEHYYVAVIQCLISKGNTRSDIKNFNSQFHSWLTSQVYPRLEDEKWYPAFGGILRITETIKRFGAEERLNEPMSHDIAFMFQKGVGFDYPSTVEKSNCTCPRFQTEHLQDGNLQLLHFHAAKDKTRDVGGIEYYYPSKSRRYYAFAILSAAAVWLIVFCGCTFLSVGVKNKNSDSDRCGRLRRMTPDPPTPPRQKSDTSLPEKKAVSFQFLVRFFKKNEGENWQLFSNSNESTNKKMLLDDLNEMKTMEKKESNKNPSFKERDDQLKGVLTDNVHNYMISDIKEHKPSKDCVKPFQFENLEVQKNLINATNESPVQMCDVSQIESTKKIQTLWKNPCVWSLNVTNDRGFDTKKKSWFRLGSKKKKLESSATESNSRSTQYSKDSSDKRTSSYSYSERCTNSSSSTTNYTSHSNLEEKCSSATMEFFENVISRHKLTKKRFLQKSSTKSESEDYSCTSDNDY